MAENTATNPRSRATEYMDYATAHGIGRVKNSPYIILKIFWVLAVLGSIIMVSIQLKRLTEKWRNFPINTKIELQTSHQMRFPAVTVCNLNPLKYSQVQQDQELASAVQVAAAKWGISLNVFEEDNIYNGTSYNVTKELNDFQVITGDADHPKYMTEYFRIKSSATNPELISNYSHQLQDVLISCTFNGKICDVSNFKEYRSYEYGICHTFGLRSENITVEDYFTVYAPGKDHGLTMILNAQQEEYLPFITDSAGLIVTIHEPDHTPHAREEGIIVSPGFNTEIAVIVHEEDRIPGPTTRCDASNEYNSLADCQRLCLQKAIEERCGCSIDVNDFVRDNAYDDEMYEYEESEVNESNDSFPKPCDGSNDTFCILRARMAQGVGEFSCVDCIIPCKLTHYVTSVSTTKWPAEAYRPVLEEILQQNSEDSVYSAADVRDNLAQMRIYLPSFTKQTLVEEQAYTDENFVSDIGGQLGLWIGFSVLSLCELVELVILIVSACCHREVKPSDSKIEKLTGDIKQ